MSKILSTVVLDHISVYLVSICLAMYLSIIFLSTYLSFIYLTSFYLSTHLSTYLDRQNTFSNYNLIKQICELIYVKK